MFTVLFTSIGRRVELVQAFKKSFETLGTEARVLGVDAEPLLAPASYFVDQYFKVPKVDEQSYADTLLGICQREKVNLLIPLFEPEFFLLDEKHAEFDKTGTFLLLSKRQVLKTCQDKWQTDQFFNCHGIKTPVTWRKEGLPNNITFPVFVKPQSGMGSRGAQRVDSFAELEFMLRQHTDLIIQEFIPGREYTLDVLADLKGQVLAVVPRERLEVRAGEVSKSRTVYRSDLIEQGKGIVEKLGAIGPVTLQCIDNGETLFIGLR